MTKIAARLQAHHAAHGQAPVPFFFVATLRPATYDALESEAYLALEDATERETVVPPAHVAEGLALACKAED